MSKVILTFKLILMMPVKTETFENSTLVKISILSENSFWMLLIRLVSYAVLRKENRSKILIVLTSTSNIKWLINHTIKSINTSVKGLFKIDFATRLKPSVQKDDNAFHKALLRVLTSTRYWKMWCKKEATLNFKAYIPRKRYQLRLYSYCKHHIKPY